MAALERVCVCVCVKERERKDGSGGEEEFEIVMSSSSLSRARFFLVGEKEGWGGSTAASAVGGYMHA